MRVVCARIKNILRFLDPPTSVLVKYLVIRRKVRPLVYSSHDAGRHISLSPTLPFSLLSFLPFADIAPLIEYT